MNKTRVRCLSFVIALALALGASSQASAESAHAGQGTHQTLLQTGRVFYVSTTGSDSNPGSSTAPFKTFAKAVSVLAPGDTLQVMPGRYAEALIMSKSGTASAPINVIGNGAIVDVRSTKNSAIKISGSYVNLSNFEAVGGLDTGISIPGKNVTVKNNIVHDNVTENGIGTCGIAGSYASALKVGVGGENILIEGNTVYRNCGEGIAITRGVNVTVRSNTVYDNFAPNIYIDNSPYSKVENNLVYCTGAVLRLDGKRPTAIGLGEEFYSGWGAQMHDVMVSGNTIRDCGKGIGLFDSEVGGTLTNITVTRNYIPSGEARAIASTSSLNRNIVISYNNIYNDVYLQVPAGITLIGNTILGSSTVPTATRVGPTPTLPSATNTTAPVATNTPVPVATNTPAPAATSTPTTAVSPAPNNPGSVADAIFSSGFESGQLTEWNGSSSAGGDLSVSPAAALGGSNGLQAVINDTTAMYVSDDTPFAEPRYRARFYFDPNSIAMANGDGHILFRGISGSSTVVVRVEFGFSNGTYQIRAAVAGDGSSWTSTNWVPISDGPHAIEFDWRAATGAGANNGGLTLWVDGAQQADLTGVDNDTWRIDRARLGALADIDAGTNGTTFFDNFESRRQSYIGP